MSQNTELQLFVFVWSAPRSTNHSAIARCSLPALYFYKLVLGTAQRQCLCERTRAQGGFFQPPQSSFALGFVFVPGAFSAPPVARATTEEKEEKGLGRQSTHAGALPDGRTPHLPESGDLARTLAVRGCARMRVHFCSRIHTHLFNGTAAASVWAFSLCSAGDNRNNKRAAEKEEREQRQRMNRAQLW